jgi:transitional endoplasmic reticulum ATPase
MRNNPRLESFVKRKLQNYPITVDDYISVSIGLNRELEFQVVELHPEGVCLVRNKAVIKIAKSPVEKIKAVKQNFEDIGGLESQVNEVRKILELKLNLPLISEKLNFDLPMGILFEGAPGTGKTLLARAIAHNLDYTFFSVIAPEIIQRYPGDSEKNLKEIFQKAKEQAPSIIFIDHIDSIIPKIQTEMVDKFKFLEHRVIAQLLGLMDGLKPRSDVVVIAATHKLDLIEPAFLRPGRFDKIIRFPLPDLNGRIQIYGIHTRNLHQSDDISIQELANLSENFTGADIKGVCQQATLNAFIRYFPEINPKSKEISENKINEIKLNKQDFLNAIKEIAERVKIID